MMPDVFIVGVTKCATTSLYDMLVQHPSVLSQHHKEPHFHYAQIKGTEFSGEADQDTVEQMFISQRADYEKLYDSELLTIDGSAMSIEDRNVLKEISGNYPNARIIICLRNPIERAFSAYSHMKRDVRESLDFKSALEKEINGERKNHLPIWHYYNSGCYVDKIRYCRELFGERLLLLDFEELRLHKSEQMQRVCRFLGLHAFNFSEKSSNRSGKPKSKTLQKAIMRKSFAKSIFVFLFPSRLRKKMKNMVLNKNTAQKELLNTDDRLFLEELYSGELDKLDGSHPDDLFLKKIYAF